MFDQLSVLEDSLERQIGFVRASESRIRFLLAVISISSGIWLTAYNSVNTEDIVALICGVVALVGLIISSYHIWSSLFPQTGENKRSLLFFGGITDRSFEEFKSDFSKLDEAGYFEDLSWQVYRNSQIAAVKYRSVELAMMFWIVSIIPLLLFLALSQVWIWHGA